VEILPTDFAGAAFGFADDGKRIAELGTRQAALRAQMDAAEAELLALYDAA
jgi:ATP-binding cassette subfamily F protein 3